MRVPSLWLPPSLSQAFASGQGHLPWHQRPPTPLRGPAAYSKSPSRYLPKAWRTTVLTAMSGFTTQNCRVAWGRS